MMKPPKPPSARRLEIELIVIGVISAIVLFQISEMIPVVPGKCSLQIEDAHQ